MTFIQLTDWGDEEHVWTIGIAIVNENGIIWIGLADMNVGDARLRIR